MNTHTVWPDRYQSAAVITVNFDGESVEQRELPGQPLWGRHSYGRYGAQTGVQRILAVFARHGVKATFFIPGWDAERYPDIVAEIAAAGHEIAGHGYAHENFSLMSPAEQDDTLARSEESFVRVFGTRPSGWRAPDGLMTKETRSILARRGYLYDSSFCDDDVPYLVANGDDRRFVEVPVFASAGDRMYYAARRSPSVVARAWTEELHAGYSAGALFNLTIHPRGDYGSGRAVRMRAVEAILLTMTELPNLWRPTCAELAKWRLNLDA